MEEYKKAIIFLLKKVQVSEKGEDVCQWSQAVSNLMAITHSGAEILKGVDQKT